MKRIAGLALALAAAACGGSSKHTAQPKASPCDAAASNIVAQFSAVHGTTLGEADQATLHRIAVERCSGDAWTPAAVACMTTANGEGFEKCADGLTEAQKDAVHAQLAKELPGVLQDHHDDAEEEVPETEAVPPPPPDDPCGGGK